MSIQRLKRLAKLESRRKPWTPPPDISGWIDATMAMCEASEAGRPLSHWPPQNDEPVPDEAKRAISYVETIAKRLREQPEFAEHEKERERRLAATMRALGREQEAREGA